MPNLRIPSEGCGTIVTFEIAMLMKLHFEKNTRLCAAHVYDILVIFINPTVF